MIILIFVNILLGLQIVIAVQLARLTLLAMNMVDNAIASPVSWVVSVIDVAQAISILRTMDVKVFIYCFTRKYLLLLYLRLKELTLLSKDKTIKYIDIVYYNVCHNVYA